MAVIKEKTGNPGIRLAILKTAHLLSLTSAMHNKRLHADAQTYVLFVGFATLTLPQKALRFGRW